MGCLILAMRLRLSQSQTLIDDPPMVWMILVLAESPDDVRLIGHERTKDDSLTRPMNSPVSTRST
jgi:hypothetical protein